MEQEQEKVQMNDRWTLIQRAERRAYHEEMKKGVDRLLSLDYMGSAEFEWGSVSQSFKLYREQGSAGNLTVHTAQTPLFTGQKWYVLCHKDFDLAEVEKRIIDASTGKMYVKEHTRFDCWLKGKPAWRSEMPSMNTWIVLVHSGYNQTSNNFVIWSLDKKLIDSLKVELSKAVPTAPPEPKVVSPEDLKVFDNVTIQLRSGYKTPAVIVGIHDAGFDAKLPDGARLKGLPYTSIIVS